MGLSLSLRQTVKTQNSANGGNPVQAGGWRVQVAFSHLCGALGYDPGMPRQRHNYGLNHLHFITAST